MKAAFTQLQRISENDPGLDRAKNICGESLLDNLKLEEVCECVCVAWLVVVIFYWARPCFDCFSDNCHVHLCQL
jgi:hypothetical protein